MGDAIAIDPTAVWECNLKVQWILGVIQAYYFLTE
jgi:hypothetical protein